MTTVISPPPGSSNRRSVAGILLRVGGAAAGLFSGLMLIGTIGALSNGSFGMSDALIGLLVFIGPTATLSWFLFRTAGRSDERACHPQQVVAPTSPARPEPARLAPPGLAHPSQLEPPVVGAASVADSRPADGRQRVSAVRHWQQDAAAAARERDAALQAQRDRDGYAVGSEWYPPKPIGSLVDAWAVGRGVEIVGEAHYPEAFRRVMGQRSGFGTYKGVETRMDAVLVPDPSNPYGRGRAVAVYVDGQHVGHLGQDDADRYFPVLSPMRANGRLLRAPARVWASDMGSTVNARVTLTLPDPSGLHPSNALPSSPFVVIPPGRVIQVTKEDEHMDMLSHYVLRGAGEVNHVAVTLRSINEIRPRSSYEAVQVELDGKRVGVLSKVQSAKLLPLVKHIEERDLVPVARAVITGTRLKAEVVLRCAAADTVDDDWLDCLGDAVTVANVDRTPTKPARPEPDWDDENEG